MLSIPANVTQHRVSERPRARSKFQIAPRGAFSLDQSRRFLQGFAPLGGTVATGDDRLRLAFGLDGGFEPVGVSLRQDEAGVVHGEVIGEGDAGRARAQVARILSLDHDATGYDELGDRDPVVGRLQRARPGFRPVCFYSPWEAAVHAVLAQRITIRQAARARALLAERFGAKVEVDGQVLPVLPSPRTLLAIDDAGIPPEQLLRLKGLAAAAEDGILDAERIRRLPIDEALAGLEGLRGIGRWSAQHIVMRGSGPTDAMPGAEPRVAAAAAIAYGARSALDARGLTALANGWRPFRMWVSVLLIAEHGFSAEARALAPRRR